MAPGRRVRFVQALPAVAPQNGGMDQPSATFVLALLLATPATAAAKDGTLLFSDDFEGSLSGWDVTDPAAFRTVESADPDHGRVLEMAPAHAQQKALVRGSERWGAYRVEGEVLFPDDRNNYLGIIYNYVEADGRADFGSLYIKGNGSYIRANPRRDWNPGRMLYEELRVPLVGPDRIEAGRWKAFAFEVRGRDCHFYVGDMTTPKITFDLFEGDSGAVGFKPRVVGGSTWLDNVRVRAIDALSYSGPSLPRVSYDPAGVVTDWRVLGPLTHAHLDLERHADPGTEGVVENGRAAAWRAGPVDRRGAVVTSRVVDFIGPRTVAYLLATVDVPAGARRRLVLSSIDDMALWLDGTFLGYVGRDALAWHDVGVNPEHEPTDWIDLEPGTHRVLVRVRGGVYAAGGFFARVVEPSSE